MSSAVEQRPIWLVLGPSGSGKSSFGQWLAGERDWLHLEIDRYPDGDGIDLNSLRLEWDDFYGKRIADGLSKAVQRRLQANKTGTALTFPGNLILDLDHIRAAANAGMSTVYLYASAADCITAFLQREQQTGRKLSLNHWIAHNRDSYMQMSGPAFAPYRINVFTDAGARRAHTEVFERLSNGE